MDIVTVVAVHFPRVVVSSVIPALAGESIKCTLLTEVNYDASSRISSKHVSVKYHGVARFEEHGPQIEQLQAHCAFKRFVILLQSHHPSAPANVGEIRTKNGTISYRN